MPDQANQFYFIWKDMDFQPVNTPPNDPDVPSITIDLVEQEIKVYLPENCGLVTSRTISRRVDSIVRTGILTPESPPRRVGMKFNVQVLGSKERINPTLLTPGHQYGSRSDITSEDESSMVTGTSPLASSSLPPEPMERSLPRSSSSTATMSSVSSSHSTQGSVLPRPVEPVIEPTTTVSSSPVAVPSTPATVATVPEEGRYLKKKPEDKFPATLKLGKLITEVLATSNDLYLTRLEGMKYHLESEHGAIVFNYEPEANILEIIEMSRLSKEMEKKLLSAISR